MFSALDLQSTGLHSATIVVLTVGPIAPTQLNQATSKMRRTRYCIMFVVIVLALVAAWLTRSNIPECKVKKPIASLTLDPTIDGPHGNAPKPLEVSYDELESRNGPYPRFKPVAEWGRNQLVCWPSIGGFWVARDVHRVMLKHMGIDRFRDSWISDSPAEEDKLCKQMQVFGLGATYYPSPDAYTADMEGWWMGCEGESRESYGIVGSPTIVLCRKQGGEGWMLENREPAVQFKDQKRNALSMEDLCDLIKDHRGKHLSDAIRASEIQQHLVKLPQPSY